MIDLTSEKLNRIKTNISVKTIYCYDEKNIYKFFKASVQPIKDGSFLLIKNTVYRAEQVSKTSFKATPIKEVDIEIEQISAIVKTLKNRNNSTLNKLL